MDIKQGLSAVAAVTLGKDMTFRDYAQGAFRMRGIGKGQKVQVTATEVQRCRQAGRQARDASRLGRGSSLPCLFYSSFSSACHTPSDS